MSKRKGKKNYMEEMKAFRSVLEKHGVLYVVNPHLDNRLTDITPIVKTYPEGEWKDVGVCSYNKSKKTVGLLPWGSSVAFSKGVFEEIMPEFTDRLNALKNAQIVSYSLELHKKKLSEKMERKRTKKAMKEKNDETKPTPQSKYAERLKHPLWQKKRLEIMQLHDFKCQKCGADDKELHIHHVAYKGQRMPWEYDNDNFMCLCAECHSKEHKK